MQNFIKSQTRLAFIQYIFQCQFNKNNTGLDNQDFLKHFYNSNISVIGEKKEFKLKFNKNFLKKLSEVYDNKFDKLDINRKINSFVNSERKFEKWDNVLKSLLFAILIELQITDNNKIKIVLTDYLNISKSLVSIKETKLLNAIIQKFLDE